MSVFADFTDTLPERLAMRRSYEIFADYHQMLLMAAEDSLSADQFTDADCKRRIVPAPGAVTLMPERNMTVPVTLEVTGVPPPLDLAAWDHIAEASLDLPHGKLVVSGLIGPPEETLDVAAGPYRVRVCGAALASLSADGLEGDDHYLIVLWPAPRAPVEVLKQFEG